MSYTLTKSSYPHFSATLSTNKTTSLSNLSVTGGIIMDLLLESGGGDYTNGYSTTTGVFTAPIKGLYNFYAILCCLNNSANGDDSGSWGFSLTVNSLTSTRLINDNPENRSSTTTEYLTSFSILTNLNAGDTVKLYGSGFDDAQTYLSNRCHFKGYLVAAYN